MVKDFLQEYCIELVIKHGVSYPLYTMIKLMEFAVENEWYEYAAIIRDKIKED